MTYKVYEIIQVQGNILRLIRDHGHKQGRLPMPADMVMDYIQV